MRWDFFSRNIAKPIVRMRAAPRTAPTIIPVVFPEEELLSEDGGGDLEVA